MKGSLGAIPKSTKLLLAVLALLLVVLAAFGWMLLQKEAPAPAVAGQAPALDSNMVAGMSLDEARKAREEQQAVQDKNKIIVSMASTAVFPSAAVQGKVDIENVMENTNSFTVTYILTADNQTAIQTGLIPPNSYVENADLLVPLAKGSYPASAIYTTYDADGAVLGRVGVAVTIEVKA